MAFLVNRAWTWFIIFAGVFPHDSGDTKYKNILFCCELLILNEKINLFLAMHGSQCTMTGVHGSLAMVKMGSQAMASLHGLNTVYHGHTWFAGKT